MEEDEEYFYDSLDEEPSLQSIILKKENSNNAIQQASQPSIFEECLDTFSEKSKISNNVTKIPLYIGEVNRDEIKYLVKKNTVSNSIVTGNKKSTSCLSTDTNLSNKKFNLLQKEKQSKSYWHIYCQKNNISLEEDLNDSARSLFGESTSRTFTSYLSSCGFNGPAWDAPSAFEKYMPKSYAVKLNDTLGNEEVISNPSSSNITLLPFDGLKEDDVFRSVSQIQLPTNQNVDITKPNSSSQSRNAQKSQSNTTNQYSWNSKLDRNKSFTSNSSNKRVLTLKDLGPNESKMSLLKKQQEYGIKASNRNRAKMFHSKISKNIKDAIKKD